jgi:hypothetical protein
VGCSECSPSAAQQRFKEDFVNLFMFPNVSNSGICFKSQVYECSTFGSFSHKVSKKCLQGVNFSQLILTENTEINSRYNDLLRTARIGNRIPVGTRYSAPVQTGLETHHVSFTTGTESFSGVKRPRCGVNYPHPSSAEVKERVELYLYSPLGLHILF